MNTKILVAWLFNILWTIIIVCLMVPIINWIAFTIGILVLPWIEIMTMLVLYT